MQENPVRDKGSDLCGLFTGPWRIRVNTAKCNESGYHYNNSIHSTLYLTLTLALYNLDRMSTNPVASWMPIPPQAFDCAQKLHAKQSSPPSFWRFVKMKHFPYFPWFPFCSSPSKLSSQHLLTLPSLWTAPRTLLIAFLGLQQLVSKLLHFSQTLTSNYQFLDPVGMRELSPAQSRLQAPVFLQCPHQ